MSDLKAALRYPWRAKNGISRLLPLALLQLIPVVGQLILMGYGQAVAGSVSNREPELPELQLGRAFGDGVRITAVGLVYSLPILLMVTVVMSSEYASAEGSATLPTIVFPLTLIAFGSLSAQIVKRRPSTQSVLSILNKIVRAGFMIFILLRLRAPFLALRDGVSLAAFQLDTSTLPLLLLALILLAIILVMLLTSGAQYAVTGSGLLQPKPLFKKMIRHPQLTLKFAFTTWSVILTTICAALLGSLFLLLPGLLICVSGTLSLWILAGTYWNKIAIETPSA